MTYPVSVKGVLKLKASVKPDEVPEMLRLPEFDDFELRQVSPTELEVSVKERTPWYPDVVAKCYAIGRFYEGVLRGVAHDDGSEYEMVIPPSREELKDAAGSTDSRTPKGMDRLQWELEKLGWTGK